MSAPVPMLVARDVAKSYGPTRALRRFTIDVTPGEVHALVGENGAGKSTLVKILSGAVALDAGEITLQGRPFGPRTPLEARAAGVSTAFQELSLLPNLSVAVNLMLPRQLRGVDGLASGSRNEARVRNILDEFDVADINPRSLVGDLSLAQKQRVEIVRAVSRHPKLLILDEPTAALAEPEWLFRIVERLSGGGTAILYISHRLGEVRRLCTRGTILRNGETIGTVDLAGTRDADIFRMMVGGTLAEPQVRIPTSARAYQGPPAIKVTSLVGASVHGVSFELARGEILGVAALEGQGQRQLLRMLAGAERTISGTIEANGVVIRPSSPAKALRGGAGIGFVPEERKTEGIFLSLSTAANISLPIIRRLTRFGLIDRGRERARVREEARQVDLAEHYLDLKVAALSGGNQQKALIGRVLLSGARQLVLFDPTRGVDVGTKQVIYTVIRRFAEAGGSVLIYSTELAELVHLADRCLALYRGAISGELSGAALSESALLALATGHALEAAE